MNKSIIYVKDLQKTYNVPVRSSGLKSAFVSLFNPTYQEVVAVKPINFEINTGEIVGLIGSNGAGKTTILKMLAGILHPSAGTVTVDNFIPSERKTEYLRTISMVFGNKSQLNFENTVSDSFEILGEIYHVPKTVFKKQMEELVDLLSIEDLLPKLVRNISLGERAKCELAAALLHRPKILFLDEPTLGLDVSMQLRVRTFIADYIKKSETTAIITSHYMADIISLCSRVILINRGELIYDGGLRDLSSKIAPFKLITFNLVPNKKADNIISKMNNSTVLSKNDGNYKLRVKKEHTSTIISELLNQFHIEDLTIEAPPIEGVIDQIYREGIR